MYVFRIKYQRVCEQRESSEKVRRKRLKGSKEGMYNTVQHPNKKQTVMNTVY